MPESLPPVATRPHLVGSRPHSRVTGRPRTFDNDEAYRRSVLERAGIDIAAGW